MSTKQFIHGKVRKLGDILSVIVSDETLDRHGEVVKLATWDLSQFVKSPRMLVDHAHQVEKIVGKWQNPRFDNGLIMDAVFHDITPLSRATKEMVENGFLDTVSVGFIPHGPEKDGGMDRNELIEVSWVTVPANPNARILKELMAKGTGEIEIKAVKDFIGEEILDGEDEEEILPDIDEDLKTINSIKEFESFKNSLLIEEVEKTFVKVSMKFLDEIISEKQKTLGGSREPKQGRSLQKEDVMRQALKEASRVISQGLYKINHS